MLLPVHETMAIDIKDLRVVCPSSLLEELP